MKKLVYSIGFVGALALTGGVTFKLVHWPGADELFVVGYLCLLLIFVPLSSIQRYSVVATTFPEKAKMILGIAAAVVAGLSGVFKIMHWPGADFYCFLERSSSLRGFFHSSFLLNTRSPFPESR